MSLQYDISNLIDQADTANSSDEQLELLQRAIEVIERWMQIIRESQRAEDE